MKDVKLFLKSGQTVEIVCEDMTVTRNELTGNVTNLKWDGVEEQSSLLHVDLSQVAAITYKNR